MKGAVSDRMGVVMTNLWVHGIISNITKYIDEVQR